MVNTPKPKGVGHMPPGTGVSGAGEWGSVPEGARGNEPIDVQGPGRTAYARVDTVDIVGSRDNSQVAGRSRWTAGYADPNHVSLQHTNLDELGEGARAQLRSLIREYIPSFHQFVNGEVAPGIVSTLFLMAEQIIVSNSRFENLKDFLGSNVMGGDYITEGEYGTYLLPGDGRAAGIAGRLGWDGEVFTNLVQMARIANHEKWADSGESSSRWSSLHMERLYRMLRFLQEKLVITDADAFVQMMFGKNGTSDRITMEDVVCIYGKAAGEDLGFYNLIEVLLNATWGDEPLLVSKKSAQGETPTGPEWHKDADDHMYVYARSMAEVAASLMHGANRQVSAAAINYSLLGEQHLHGAGASEGKYDFYLRELFRKEARQDLMRCPELYYDGVKPWSERTLSDLADDGGARDAVMNNERALARLREIYAGTDFEEEAAQITDAAAFIEPNRGLFRHMSLDVSWVDDVAHYARATLYALLSVARFNQAGEEVMRRDPEFASNLFSLARHMITVYEERSIVLQYLSGPVKKGVVDIIIQPFDMLMFNKLFDRIKRNQRLVAPRKGPPPRKRRK